MIQVDARYIEPMRKLQEMFLHTTAGGLLLIGILEKGHINHPLDTEEHRIEYNLAQRLLRDSGIELVPRAAELVANEPSDINVIDKTLGFHEGDDDVE